MEELLVLYALEGFLARLQGSRRSDDFVLKGGVLLAAFGTRRATRDVDLAGREIDNDIQQVLRSIRSIASSDLPADSEDGLVFDTSLATAEVIRDEDEYSGVRVSLEVRLATANMRFHVDVNIGDPIWPAPEEVEIPRLLGGPAIELAGYPLQMVYAEKIVTAMQRGIVNTRWRDFGDVWTLNGSDRVEHDPFGEHGCVSDSINAAEKESVWDYPRPPIVVPSREHVVIEFDGESIVDTRRPLRVLETSHPPVYYVPVEDIAPGSLSPVAGTTWCEFKGSASYFDLVGQSGRTAQRAAWRYAHPTAGYGVLAGHVAFYPGLMERCSVDGETVIRQEGDFYGGWITSRVTGPFKGGPGTTGW